MAFDMNRRDFVRYLALVGAGAAARPEQIAAFERYYEANTPLRGDSFIAVDEISVGGLAWTAKPMTVNLYEGDVIRVAQALNLFGGCSFWRAAPDSKVVARPEDLWVKCRLMNGARREKDDNLPDMDDLQGYVTWVDMNAVRHKRMLVKPDTWLGNLPYGA